MDQFTLRLKEPWVLTFNYDHMGGERKLVNTKDSNSEYVI